MINELIKLGKIPNDNDMSDQLFYEYDTLIQSINFGTPEQIDKIICMFSDDCYDLNWGLLHLIEYLTSSYMIAEYRQLITKCNNSEFKEILISRLNNSINKNPVST